MLASGSRPDPAEDVGLRGLGLGLGCIDSCGEENKLTFLQRPDRALTKINLLGKCNIEPELYPVQDTFSGSPIDASISPTERSPHVRSCRNPLGVSI